MQRFVVRSGDGRTLSELLDRAHVDGDAVVDGRVFVGRLRATDPNLALSVGDEVFVAKRAEPAQATPLLGRDRDIFAFMKPAGLATVPDRRGNVSLLHAVARELGVTPSGLHVVTRLDTNVSGVVIVAHGKDATRRAAALQAGGGLVRRYWGLSMCAPSPPAGVWSREVPVKPRIAGSRSAETRAASTAYRVIAQARLTPGGLPALIAFRPLTGRTHQIRIHSAGAGAPLLGDPAYGGAKRVIVESGAVLEVSRVALHASAVELASAGCEPFRVEAPHPEDLTSLWVRLGGAEDAFDVARSTPMEDR
jgi:23S rRNA-/tRNA-specific pseudouridylate synthase